MGKQNRDYDKFVMQALLNQLAKKAANRQNPICRRWAEAFDNDWRTNNEKGNINHRFDFINLPNGRLCGYLLRRAQAPEAPPCQM